MNNLEYKMVIRKRGQGLPLNTIVIAVIVLIVLAVVIFIFSSRFGLFGTEISACEQKGGVCKVRANCNLQTSTILTGFECKDSKVCCLSVLKEVEREAS